MVVAIHLQLRQKRLSTPVLLSDTQFLIYSAMFFAVQALLTARSINAAFNELRLKECEIMNSKMTRKYTLTAIAKPRRETQLV